MNPRQAQQQRAALEPLVFEVPLPEQEAERLELVRYFTDGRDEGLNLFLFRIYTYVHIHARAHVYVCTHLMYFQMYEYKRMSITFCCREWLEGSPAGGSYGFSGWGGFGLRNGVL